MRRIKVTKDIRGIKYRLDCPFCGFNTSLIPDEKKAVVNGKVYCSSCLKEGKSIKTVTPGDFFFSEYFGDNLAMESICRELPMLELAHLYGTLFEEDDMHLDMFYDRATEKVYFRLEMVDDPDPWFGTVSYKYVSAEKAVELLNKNGIHVLDGMTELNWKEYFEFTF